MKGYAIREERGRHVWSIRKGGSLRVEVFVSERYGEGEVGMVVRGLADARHEIDFRLWELCAKYISPATRLIDQQPPCQMSILVDV